MGYTDLLGAEGRGPIQTRACMTLGAMCRGKITSTAGVSGDNDRGGSGGDGVCGGGGGDGGGWRVAGGG